MFLTAPDNYPRDIRLVQRVKVEKPQGVGKEHCRF
jgi:hypothetical protein